MRKIKVKKLSPYAGSRVFLSTILALAILGSALPTKKAFSQSKATKKPRTVVSPSTVSESTQSVWIPFDATIKELPRRYSGHSIKELTQTLRVREKEFSKSEFETQDAYKTRILQISKELGHGLLVFSQPRNPNYDAEKEVFKVSVGLERILMHPYEHFFIPLATSERRTGTYVGANAYGRTETVSAFHETRWGLAIIDSVVRVSKVAVFDQQIFGFAALTVSLPAKLSEAPDIKKTLRVLFVGKPVAPILTIFNRTRSPTLTRPIDDTIDSVGVHFDLEAIWLYNYETGEVYQRIAFARPS